MEPRPTFLPLNFGSVFLPSAEPPRMGTTRSCRPANIWGQFNFSQHLIHIAIIRLLAGRTQSSTETIFWHRSDSCGGQSIMLDLGTKGLSWCAWVFPSLVTIANALPGLYLSLFCLLFCTISSLDMCNYAKKNNVEKKAKIRFLVKIFQLVASFLDG